MENQEKKKSFWQTFRENFQKIQEETTEQTEEKEDQPVEKLGFFKKLRFAYQKSKEEMAIEQEKLNLYENIATAAVISKEFIVLLMGSCLIAIFGLYQNSAAVIIGAMLIAPLMMPILAIAISSLWGDRKLFLKAFTTLLVGSIVVFLIAYFLTLTIPGIEITPEMRGRINPNLYDIFIAIASGLVGAYAYVNPRISSSISGVVIAVALMPPLCTVGIMGGLYHWEFALGALLLYMTNLVGIALAASIVFWRLHVTPSYVQKEEVTERAKRNILVAGILLLLIATPLTYFMIETFELKKFRANSRKLIEQTLQPEEILSFEVQRFHNTLSLRLIPIVQKENYSKRIENFKKTLTKKYNDYQLKFAITPIFTSDAQHLAENR